MSGYGHNHASSSRAGSTAPSIAGAGSRAFLDRLGSVTAAGSSVYGGGGTGVPETDVGTEHGDDDGDIFGPRDAAAGDEPVPGVFTAEDLSAGPDEDELDDVRRLGRVWVRERGTPAILPWEGELLDSLLDKLEQQQKMLALLRSDPATSEEEHFRLMLVQTEMERAKYLVRSYVRCRLHKIEKFAQHVVDTPELHPKLSGAELQHAERYAELVAGHYTHSVLDSLPDWLRRLDDTHNGVSMIATPNVETPVLIFCRKDCGEISLERGETAVLAKDTTHLVRYDLVERWIQLGWAEVL